MDRIGGGFVAARRRENGSVTLVWEAVTVENLARRVGLERRRRGCLREKWMRKVAWRKQMLGPANGAGHGEVMWLLIVEDQGAVPDRQAVADWLILIQVRALGTLQIK